MTTLSIYPHLKILNCNNNKITTLPYYPMLVELFCYHNNLTNLPEYHNLEYIYCQNNQLTRLPHIHNWRNLVEIYYYNNPIENIHPRTVRFLENLQRRRADEYYENNTVYNDNENVHNHTIQSSIKQSIDALLDQVYE